MKLLNENMEELLTKANYVKRMDDEDKELNDYSNYWNLLQEKEEVIQSLTNASLDTILFSKYYWSAKYIERHKKIYGPDAGAEQQQFQIIEEIDQRIKGEVDWEIIKLIDESVE